MKKILSKISQKQGMAGYGNPIWEELPERSVELYRIFVQKIRVSFYDLAVASTV
jgi:hypothetical protein